MAVEGLQSASGADLRIPSRGIHHSPVLSGRMSMRARAECSTVFGSSPVEMQIGRPVRTIRLLYLLAGYASDHRDGSQLREAEEDAVKTRRSGKPPPGRSRTRTCGRSP